MPYNPALGDAYRQVVVTQGLTSETTTARAVDAQFNLDAGFGISLVTDVLNNKVTIVNTGNGTGALTTITDNNSLGTFYPIFTRSPTSAITFTAGSEYVSASVPIGLSEIRITGSSNDPTGVSYELRTALTGLVAGETFQGVKVSDSATLNFTAAGPASYSTTNGYWTVPIDTPNPLVESLSSITIATGSGNYNQDTGTYQMDTMYLDMTTTPLSYNPSTNTITVSNLSGVSFTMSGHVTLEGVTSTGATGTGKFVFDTDSTLVGTTTFIDNAPGTSYTVLIQGINGAGSMFGIGTGTDGYGIANDALNHTQTGYVPYNITASTLSFNVPSHVGSISIDASGNTTINGHPTIEGQTLTGVTGTGKLVLDNAPTISGHPTIEGVTSTGATGTGNFVFDTSPTLITPLLGTPQSGNFSTGTFTWPTFNQNTSGYSANLSGGNNTTLLGSVHYQSALNVTTQLAPNTTTTKKFLRQTGDGTNGAAPAWDTVTATDVGLGNVTNESKATMFTDPTFTGHPTIEGITSTGATGTGKFVFDTVPTIAGGSHTGITSLGIRDTSAAFDVTLAATSSTALTAGRTLTLDVVNAARTVKLAGNIDIANNLTTSGNFALTLTTTNTTNVTLPTGTVTLYGTGTGTITSTQLATSLSDETGSGSVVFGTNPTITAPTSGNSSSTTDADATVDASTTEYYAYVQSASGTARTINISNLTAGRKVTLYLRNTNAATKAISITASINTTGFAAVNLSNGAGAASVTAVTLAATSGTATITVFNANGTFGGGII